VPRTGRTVCHCPEKPFDANARASVGGGVATNLDSGEIVTQERFQPPNNLDDVDDHTKDPARRERVSESTLVG
jgi:hypothetical protein